MVHRAADRHPAAALAGLTLLIAALASAAQSATATGKDKPAATVYGRMPPLRPAVIDDTLEIGGDEIAARKLNTRLTVEVGVNGTGPYRFVVDSGADTSVIGARLAAGLALPAGRSVVLNAMTESRRVDRVLVDALQIGPSQFRALELPRLEERHIGATGMIGLDALVEQRLMLDFEKRLIRVEDASRPAPRMDGEIVVTARLKRGQLILTQVKARGLALDAVVDTGSEVTIGNSALREKIARRRDAKVVKAEMLGVTGKSQEVELIYVEELKIGSITLTNVPIAFADVPPFRVFDLDKRPALLLGTDLMENFRKVSLDFRARKVRFQLRKCAPHGRMIRFGDATILRGDLDNPAACQL
ncbi:MAG: retroviral-like aspartic protease family protein [Novosphingobium sp.]